MFGYQRNNNTWQITLINSFNPYNGYCYPHFTGEETVKWGSWSKVIRGKESPEYSRYWHCQENLVWGGQMEIKYDTFKCPFCSGQLPASSHQLLMVSWETSTIIISLLRKETRLKVGSGLFKVNGTAGTQNQVFWLQGYAHPLLNIPPLLEEESGLRFWGLETWTQKQPLLEPEVIWASWGAQVPTTLGSTNMEFTHVISLTFWVPHWFWVW